MPRLQPDLEEIQTREDLARALTVLRSRSGLTVRELAKLLDAPSATLGDYFAGRHLPGPRQLDLYRSLLAACGVVEPGDQAAWIAALTRARLATDGRAAKGPPPYRGLEPFGEADEELFFGRSAAVEELLDQLRRRRDQASTAERLVALVGPSGSGKSSLLMAGLAPAIARGALDTGAKRCRCLKVTPEQLLGPSSTGVLDAADEACVVVILDQFEDAFALAADSREELFGRMAELCRDGLVVLGLRADFYHVASAEPALIGALRRSQVLLGPMSEQELREAIEGPARLAGTAVDGELVDLVLADAAPGSPHGYAHAPGALPLLSYALLAAWRQAPRNHLTAADYIAVGGIRGAVRQAAEGLYCGLTATEQEVARLIFAHLVRVDRDGPATRRSASRQELLEVGSGRGGTATVAAVLERFVAARLLTTDADTVQISHEALLHAWPRLGEWVEADREWMRFHSHLADSARDWVEAGRDDSTLLQGAHLEAALDRARDAGHHLQLNQVERDFLAASTAFRDQQQRAARRRTRRTQQLLGAVTVLAAAAVVFAGVAVEARDAATKAKDQALSRQVAIEAEQLRPTDPSLAAQLALAAYRISPTVQARSALVDSTAGEIPTRLLGPAGPEFVSVSRGGRLLAVAHSATDTVALYKLGPSRSTELSEVSAGPRRSQDFAVAISPDGKLLAAGGGDGALAVWRTGSAVGAAGSTKPSVASGSGSSAIETLAFSPDGSELVTGGDDLEMRVWKLGAGGRLPLARRPIEVATDPSRPVALGPPLTGSKPYVEQLGFSPNAKLLAASDDSGQVRLWDLRDPARPRPLPTLTGTTGEVLGFAFSADSRLVATASTDKRVRLYDLSNPARPVETATVGGFSNYVYDTAFTPDGRTLIACSADGTIRLWDISDLHHPRPLGRPLTGPTGYVYAIDVGPGGHTLAAAVTTHAVWVWDIANPAHPRLEETLNAPQAEVFAVTFSEDGRTLAASGSDDTVHLWAFRPADAARQVCSSVGDAITRA